MALPQTDYQGKVIVISSVSGGGKTSLVRLLLRHHPNLFSAVTATTRKPRTGEVHGVDYFFYSVEEFQELLHKNEFLEYALVHGNYYGVPAGPVDERIRAGQSVILNIDVQGMRSVRARLKEKMISIFVLPPDRDTWEARLRQRGTNTDEEIQMRMAEGTEQLDAAGEYDFIVINEFLDQVAGEVTAILQERGIRLEA